MTATEQATIQFQLPPIWAYGTMQDGGMIFLENYVDRPLPLPISILGSVLWVDGTTVSQGAGNIIGNVPLTIDPQCQYAKETGWPFGNGSPVYQPIYYKMIAERRVEDPRNRVEYVPPGGGLIRYSAGDGIAVSPECSGGNGTTPLQVYAQINIVAPVAGGDLKDLPTPSGFYESKVPMTSATGAGGGTGSCVRMLFPGPPQATTKFRARIFHRGGAPGISQVQHASVGLQSGNTSSCQATPVQLKFGSQDNYNIINGDRLWTNTIDLACPANQPVLVTISSFVAGSGNFWSLNTSGGNGMWYSTSDSWNTAAMQGSPTFYANMTRTVDAIQMW